MMRETENYSRRKRKEWKEAPDRPFLQELRKHSGRGRGTLVFLIAVSAFSFSATTQMAFSMKKLSSEAFAGMMVTIGLVLAYVIVFLSLTSAVREHTKTIAMMRALGYPHRACSRAVLGGYRPAALIGFALGTLYQYGLLKLMVLVIFADVGIPEYHFDFAALAVSLAVYVVSYELILSVFSVKIKRLSLKSVMLG